MTPHEIRTELDAISELAGPHSFACVSMNAEKNAYNVKLICAACYFDSAMNHRISAYGDTFEEAFAALRSEMTSNLSKAHAATIRKLALSIITTTADLGECSDAALRGNGFSQSEIDMHGAAACAEATRMAAGGPFEIIKLSTLANAAE